MVPPGVVLEVALLSMWRSLKAPTPPFATTVGTELSLLNSLPSGIVLSGSTTAWLM
jgi:hypothetical protein